jgi:DNA-nicking Smr family endonuclease
VSTTRRDDLHAQWARVRTHLAEREREEQAAQAREAERVRRERAQREQFARAVGPVRPVVAAARVVTAAAPVEPVPRQRMADESRALAQSLSDEFDASTLLESDEQLSYRRAGIGADVLVRLRRGEWAIQRHLDLHGHKREAAREALAAFVHRAERDGLRCVRVVHGKGNGSPGREPVLKAKVRAWLVQKAEVIAFTQARATDGGNGALLVLLRGRRAR